MTSARGGILVAEAEEVSINPKLATYLIRILDEEETLIALFQGTVYRKREGLREVTS
jgi:acyl-CoA thioesterase